MNYNMRVIVDLHDQRSKTVLLPDTRSRTRGTEIIPSFYCNFEDGNTGGWYSNDATNVSVTVVDNPLKDDVNDSGNVMEIKKTLGGKDWMGAEITNFSLPAGEAGTSQFKYLRIKLFSPKAMNIGITIKDGEGKDFYTGYDIKGDNVGKWIDESIKFGNKITTGYLTKIVLRPHNFDENGTAIYEGDLFIDNVFLSHTRGSSDNTVVIETEDPEPEEPDSDVLPIWTNKTAQLNYRKIWDVLSDELKDYPNEWVAYELMNEPVAPYSNQWNALAADVIRDIRLKEPERKIVVGPNNWQNVENFIDFTIPEGDSNIIVDFHFYEPHLVTHYGATWIAVGKLPQNLSINYPGRPITEEVYESLSDENKDIVRKYMGIDYNKDYLESQIQIAIDYAQLHGLQLHCGEFGCYRYTNRESRLNWIRDIVSIFKDKNISYAFWEYKWGWGFCNNKTGELEDEEILNILTK